jgi:hypothetical protein
MNDIVDRLRGIYRIPITDGLGAVKGSEEPDNENEFVRKFETPPIQKEAADEIEELRVKVEELETSIEEALNCASETQSSHGHMFIQVMSSIGYDFGDPESINYSIMMEVMDEFLFYIKQRENVNYDLINESIENYIKHKKMELYSK